LLAKVLEFFEVTVSSNGIAITVILFFAFSILNFIFSYVKQSFMAAYVFIIERKRITPIKWYKKVWFCLTFPIFDLIGKVTTAVALFKRVEWKPIRHGVSTNIAEIEKSLERK
jgi:L-cystine uptake protein TcyP (sodium:dicarboxylate symporter family)